MAVWQSCCFQHAELENSLYLCLLQQMLELEETMMFQEVSIPVYFAEWSPHLRDILDDISHSFMADGRASSAAEGR